jgi:outer membrane protein assembly factor BamD (BamD/ComL family)
MAELFSIPMKQSAHAEHLYVLAEAYIKMGQKDEADRLLKELRRQSETGFVPPGIHAQSFGKTKSQPRRVGG